MASFIVSIPLSFSIALAEIFMNQTVNRKNIYELLNKLNDIEKTILKYEDSLVINSKLCSDTKVSVLILVLTLYLCLDAVLWGHRMGLIGEGTLRMSQLIQVLFIIQFCKLTQFLRHNLKILNRVLSSSVEHKLHKYNTYKRELSKNINPAAICTDFIKVSEHMSISDRVSVVGDSTCDNVIYDTWKSEVYLIEIRRIYRQIYDCIGYVNSIYGLPILLELIRNTAATICFILRLIALLRAEVLFSNTSAYPKEIFTFLNVFWLVIFVFRYAAITICCHMATSEANKIQDNVQHLLLRKNVRSEVLEQLKLFSCQLVVNRIEFTACGFFSVNLKTLSTFVASVLTYIIVFEQMKD
jgi:hypothetical protein